MSSTVILKASGLTTSPNELTREEGALIQASNVIIRRDNMVEQRRGFKLWGTALPESNERVKQLTTYRNRIIHHYSNKIQFDSNGSGNFESFSGSFLETQSGLRMKFVESNGNLYFTTSQGIKKMSARSADDFTTNTNYIVSAGAVKAVDLTGKTVFAANSQSAWFTQDSAVAYRVLWAYKDLNGNLVPGTPSQRLVLSNSMLDLLLQDYMRVLSVLDGFTNSPASTARINDKNYLETLGVNLTTSAAQLQSSLIACTTKIDNDILYANQAATAPLQITAANVSSGICTINVTGATVSTYLSPGSKIFLDGFGTGVLNGMQEVLSVDDGLGHILFNTTEPNGAVSLASATINSGTYRSITQPSVPTTPVTNDSLVEMQNYISDIILALSDEPITVISASDQVAVADLDVTTTATTELTITIPDGIDSNYFFQVYRSSLSTATGAASFDDVVPSDELQLVYEAYPTTPELESGFVTFEDITPDAFRGANLYTNASTGEGILAANEQPPFAKDVARYRNSIFYANTRTRQRMDLNLLGVTKMVADYNLSIIPKLTTSNGTVSNTYEFVLGAAQKIQVTTVADVADSLNGTYWLFSSLDNDYYVWYNTGAGVDPAIANRTGIEISISTGATADQVAIATFNQIVVKIGEFITTRALNVLTIENLSSGYCAAPSAGTSGFAISTVISGVGEAVQPEITSITTVAGASYVNAGPADYFLINSTNDSIRYYVWFNVGASVDPALAGYYPVEVILTGAETAPQVATAIKAALDALPSFLTEVNSNVVTVTNKQYGRCTAASEFVSAGGFTVSQTQEGMLQVLLSPEVSPAIAVDETARSFVRVMNKNPEETIYAYYLSSTFDVPGKMSLEARSIETTDTFYIVGNNDNTGVSFNPDIGPEITISAIGTGSAPTVTTSAAHYLESGDKIVITNSDSFPSIDGLWTVTVTGTNTFILNDGYVVAGGTQGAAINAAVSVYSENESKSNRVYYSKFQQPEAVPLVNYFDVGASDKEILRIIALRNSLFVFKEDGLYRISGESAPFQLELFDISFNIIAPDSAAVCNNVIYVWTTQGIQSLTEGGASIISRNIDNIILKTQSSNYTNFKTATWGVGYESDNSYIVYTVSQETDAVATIAYRYSTLTNSWTTFDLSHGAGVVNPADDKLYLAATDVAYIEQERKSFSRLDYADREVGSVISSNKLLANKIILATVTGLSVGDVVVQDQTITTDQFNTLLRKLDSDSGVQDNNYEATLSMVAGDSPRVKLEALANKLDADAGVAYTQFFNDIDSKTGSITSIADGTNSIITSAGHGLLSGRVILIDSSDSVPSVNGTYPVTVIDANTFSIPAKVRVAGTAGNFQTVDTNFEDIKACYNHICNVLNTDTQVSFNNYKIIDNNTIQEAIITGINRITRQITLGLTLPYLVGDITIYKAFESSITYSPVTMGDPLQLKHLREATMMFETRTFSGGILSFATDLLPEFVPVEFKLEGNGIFGHQDFGSGFFGGMSNSAPFRTYVPRQCQRCRYMVLKFSHKIAREDYKVTGCTLTGEIGQSTRAYR